MNLYVIVYDCNFLDEYCFSDMEHFLKFKNDYPELTFGDIHYEPILEWSK